MLKRTKQILQILRLYAVFCSPIMHITCYKCIKWHYLKNICLLQIIRWSFISLLRIAKSCLHLSGTSSANGLRILVTSYGDIIALTVASLIDINRFNIRNTHVSQFAKYLSNIKRDSFSNSEVTLIWTLTYFSFPKYLAWAFILCCNLSGSRRIVKGKGGTAVITACIFRIASSLRKLSLRRWCRRDQNKRK